MKVNRKKVNLIERLAYKYRHRQANGIKTRNSLQVSKAQHPSRTRQNDRANARVEAGNDRQLGI